MSDEQQDRRNTDAQVAVLQNDVNWIKETMASHAKTTTAALERIEKKLEEGAKTRDNLARLGAIGSAIGTALLAGWGALGGGK